MRPQAATSSTEMKTRMPMVLVNRGRNDDAYAERHGADKNRERHVVFLDDFFPEMVRREPVHHHERDHEDKDPNKPENQSGDEMPERNKLRLICPLGKGKS